MKTSQERELDRDNLLATIALSYRQGDWELFLKACRVLDARQKCEWGQLESTGPVNDNKSGH
jgi:hypothetical protein